MNDPIPASLLLAELSPTAGSFIVMTAASVILLWVLPHTQRHHVRKIGTYHHELCHGLASLATGGDFHRFHVHPTGGGVAVTSGGNQKVITSAGYIGTILIGAIFLAHSADHQPLITALQIIAFLLAVSTIKAGDLHTAAVGVIVSAALGLCSTIWPNTTVARFLMNLLGMILVWQGFETLLVLLKLSATQTDTGSDAEAMAHLTGRSAVHWALVFAGIALMVLVLVVGIAVRTGIVVY